MSSSTEVMAVGALGQVRSSLTVGASERERESIRGGKKLLLVSCPAAAIAEHDLRGNVWQFTDNCQFRQPQRPVVVNSSWQRPPIGGRRLIAVNTTITASDDGDSEASGPDRN